MEVLVSQWVPPGQVYTGKLDDTFYLIVPASISPWALEAVHKMVGARNALDRDIRYFKRLFGK